MHNLLKVLILIGFSLWNFSCSNSENPEAHSAESQNTIYSKVIIPAGDVFKDFGRLGVPAFFNIGTVEQKKGSEVVIRAIILGERLEKGKRVVVRPIAFFSFKQDSIQQNYLVTSYKAEENMYLGSEFNAFMSINNELRLAIENWFRAQCGFSACNSYAWNDTYRAFINMDENK